MAGADAAVVQADRERVRAKRTRRAAFAVLAAALVLSVVAVVVSISAATTRVEDVAPLLAEPVAQRVLADGRADSAAGARRELDAANQRLAARLLPLVPQPDADAPTYRIQIQAARAYVLADLPEPIAEQLRQAVADGNAPPVFPSLLTIPIAPGGGDRTVTLLPSAGSAPGRSGSSSGGTSNGDGSGGSSSGGGTPDRPTTARPAPAPAPAPTTAPRRPGLLDPLLNLPLVRDLPLVGR